MMDEYPHPDERISRIISATIERFGEVVAEEGVPPMVALVALHEAATGLRQAAQVMEAAADISFSTGGPVAVVLTEEGELAIARVTFPDQATDDA